MKVVIVGGVAGGASCATRLRRLDESAEIIIFERGENVSYANCGLPYYIGRKIEREEDLTVASPQFLKARFNIDVRTLSEVTAIDRKAHTVTVRSAKGEYKESYDKLVLTPGASAKTFGFGGEGVFTLRDVRNTLDLDNYIVKNGVKTALVAGGGFIGVEIAENLIRRGIKVTLAEFAPQLMPPFDKETALLVADALTAGGVDVRVNTGVKAVEKASGGLKVTFTTGESMQAGAVILALGVAPETALAKAAGIELSSTGGIKTDEFMRTNDKDIFAAGDVIAVTGADGNETLIPLAGPANRQGRSVAANLLGGKESNGKKVLGASVVKVFDLTAASVGRNEKQLQKAGVKYKKAYAFPMTHAGYYPGATQLTLKLLFGDKGEIYGAQAAGKENVEKQIDVISAVMKLGGSVHDLAQMELCYAPPYNSAKSPVNMLGFIAENILSGLCPTAYAEELTQDDFILDVRMPGECARGGIPGAVNIPLDTLREHLSELPKDRKIIVSCAVGLRGYLGTRILRQHGFDAVNLSGGYRIYSLYSRLQGK